MNEGALEYLTTLPRRDDAQGYEDLLGEALFSGLKLTTPSQRKSLQNGVGKALEYMMSEALGFHHLDIEGADIVSHERGVIEEIKNRHNTLNAGGKSRLVGVMKKLNLQPEYRGYSRYLVIAHPKSAGYEKNVGQLVVEISAAKFFNKFGKSFEEYYLDLVEKVCAYYNVPMPEISDYYKNVVFPVRKKKRRPLTRRG